MHKFVPAHEFTLRAATAALAADKQGKFWEFHDKLFGNQSVLNEAKIIEIAGTLKLNMEFFGRSLKDPVLKQLIERDYEDTQELGIRSTPAVYINGRHLERPRSFADLDNAIKAEMER